MNLSTTATSILVIWYIAGSLLSISIIAAMTVALIKLSKRLESLESKITPLIDQTSEILRTVNKTVIQAEPGLEHILSNVESTTGNVAKTTETVATAASRIASNPLAEVTAMKEAVLNLGKRGR
jgi:biopolymer transport protein ExbB/TolQ